MNSKKVESKKKLIRQLEAILSGKLKSNHVISIPLGKLAYQKLESFNNYFSCYRVYNMILLIFDLDLDFKSPHLTLK